MKKITSNALMFVLAVAIAGALFKLFHLPGANILLICGLSSVMVVALIKGCIEQTLESIVTGCAIAIASAAVLFRLMHWSNADLLIKLAIAGGIIWAFASFRNKSE